MTYKNVRTIHSPAAYRLLLTGYAQSPTVEKVDPPNWWVGSTINPVRVLVRGTNLAGTRAESASPGMVISNVKISANGHYLFTDIKVENGKINIKIPARTAAIFTMKN